MNSKVIVIDGKSYHSIDEMPPDIRQKYEQVMRSLGPVGTDPSANAAVRNVFADQDGNGIPDILEEDASGQTSMTSMKIIVDGREYHAVEDLPLEARRRYEQALGSLDANRNGVPDFVEGWTNATNQTANVSTDLPLGAPPRSTPLPVTQTITPDTTNGWMLALVGLFLLLVCAAVAAGVWYFFLR